MTTTKQYANNTKTYTVVGETNGHRNAYDCKSKAAAIEVMQELAVQGITVHAFTPAGNCFSGYLAEQGPVKVVDGALVRA